MDLNHRPQHYQCCALTSWAIRPRTKKVITFFHAYSQIRFPKVYTRSERMERVMGLEPTTVCLEGRGSSHWATPASKMETCPEFWKSWKLVYCIKTLALVKTFFVNFILRPIFSLFLGCFLVLFGSFDV